MPTRKKGKKENFFKRLQEQVTKITGGGTKKDIDKFSVRQQAEMALPINKLDDKKAALRLLSDYENAVEFKRDDIVRAQRYENIYMALDAPEDIIDETTGLIEDDKEAYSNTYLPVGAAVVDSGLAKLYNTLFPTPNYFEITSDDFEDGLFASEVTGHLMKRHREMKFKLKTYQALQQACMYDYGVTCTRWLLEDGYQPRPRKFDEEVQFDKIKVKRKVVKSESFYLPDKTDRSDMVVLNFMRSYPDPSAQGGLEDSRFFCDDVDVTLEELMMNSKIAKPWGRYQNIDKVVQSALLTIKSDLDEITDVDIRREFVNSHRVKKIRYWTHSHIIEYAEGHIIFRHNVPDWCLNIWKISYLPNRFRGMGLLERMERNQYDINASMNSRRDFQNLISNPFVIMDQSLLTANDGVPQIQSGAVLVSRSGEPKNKIHVHNPGQYGNQESFAEISQNVDIIEEQTGVSENDKGQISGGRTTATETRTASQGSQTRTGTVAQLIEESCLEPIYLQMFFLEQQFLNRADSFKYNGGFGDEFFKVDSSSYMWNSIPNFKAKGTFSLGEDIVQTQQFLAGIDRMLAMPMVKWNWQNIAVEMARRLMPHKAGDWVEDPTAPEENIPPDVENQMIANGQTVRVSPANDPTVHIPAHEALRRSADFFTWPEARKMALDQHIAEHGQGQGNPLAAASNPQTLGPGQDPGANALRGIRPPAVGGVA